MPHASHFVLKKFIQHYQPFPKSIPHVIRGCLAEQKFPDCLRTKWNSYCTSKYLAKSLNCWDSTIMGRFKEFGGKKMWSTWVYHILDRERLQIVKRCRGTLLKISLVVQLFAWLSIFASARFKSWPVSTQCAAMSDALMLQFLIADRCSLSLVASFLEVCPV